MAVSTLDFIESERQNLLTSSAYYSERACLIQTINAAPIGSEKAELGSPHVIVPRPLLIHRNRLVI